MQKQGTHLKIFCMRLDKFSFHCIKQSKSEKAYTRNYWNQYKDEYISHELKKQQKYWCTQASTWSYSRNWSTKCYNRLTLLNIRIYYTWKNFKQSFRNSKVKILGATWDKMFELSNEFYPISDI